MAGGGELGGGKSERRGKKGKRKAKKRLGFRLDMTPLVDITFLLLTFFMLTTSMLKPQTMDMSVPPEIDKPVEVRESELLTIRIRKDGSIFANMAKEEPTKYGVKNLSNLHKLVVEKNVQLKNRCIVVLKSSPEASFGVVVSVLDMLNAAEPEIINSLRASGINERKRKFTIAPFDTENDAKELEGK